ncbi:MAG: hypothetical protein ACFCU5_06605 [Pleurocapsa sp.]
MTSPPTPLLVGEGSKIIICYQLNSLEIAINSLPFTSTVDESCLVNAFSPTNDTSERNEEKINETT